MCFSILNFGFDSFNPSPDRTNYTIGFTVNWYNIFRSEEFFSALKNSLIISVTVVGILALLGTLMVIGLGVYQLSSKNWYSGISYLRLIIPDLVIAVAILVFLAAFVIPLSVWTIIAAHIVFCLAYMVLVLCSRVANLDSHLLEAALDLGATPRQAFMKVLLPQLTPSIRTSCLLAFVLSLVDFLLGSLTLGSGCNNLQGEILCRLRTELQPEINTLSIFLITGVVLIVLVAEFIRAFDNKK
ncbi:ABC transporter permease [Anabaenopsis elenkinii]|uniref:ABC transporter permease n=1 Tax=Anabaenopsis elenkinii CCIBt3563 TaxID=2779889 RepID=A0A7U3NL09_9CYAN|nr:ABC transporter permease [Anabaenopsis elenkinii]QOV21186.1 ABC transporter permease [Anabaenopsis elenkinii CCIBt3563]